MNGDVFPLDHRRAAFRPRIAAAIEQKSEEQEAWENPEHSCQTTTIRSQFPIAKSPDHASFLIRVSVPT